MKGYQNHDRLNQTASYELYNDLQDNSINKKKIIKFISLPDEKNNGAQNDHLLNICNDGNK